MQYQNPQAQEKYPVRKLMLTGMLALGLLMAADGAFAQRSKSWNIGMFSRANCGNNESISWDRSADASYWEMAVGSRMSSASLGREHFYEDGPRVDWRVGNVNWFRAFGGDWIVEGIHDLGPNRDMDPLDQEYAVDLIRENCGGWWAGSAVGSVWLCKETWASDCSLAEW
ncbi:hypothetical protein [Achromobacter sp.]|uniref:hypothetical protein n=1 Tax=Achromobacter sp. TaxID=134375 RepID=UPI003C71AC99